MTTSNTVGTLSVSGATVTLAGYVFNEPPAWPADLPRSHALWAIEAQMDQLRVLRSQLMSDVETMDNSVIVVETANVQAPT